jgi:hypothetical protein
MRTNSKIKKAIVKIADYLDKEGLIEISLDKVLSSDVASMKVASIGEDIYLMITENSSSYFIGKETGKGWISRCKSLPYEEWRHKYSISTFGSKMAEVIKQMEKNDDNLQFESVDDDGEHFDIWYKVKFLKGTKIQDCVRFILNFEKELVCHTETMLDSQKISEEVLKNEEDFILNVLLPLFRSMGYQGVHLTHGQREFGKDIIFSEIDKLGIRRNFGVQVKTGDVTGEANSQLDKLIGQIDDAFKMSYVDIYTKEERHITDLIIAISGKFTGNAPQKIHEKIHNRNVHFLDIDKVKELLTKYMNKQIQ